MIHLPYRHRKQILHNHFQFNKRHPEKSHHAFHHNILHILLHKILLEKVPQMQLSQIQNKDHQKFKFRQTLQQDNHLTKLNHILLPNLSFTKYSPYSNNKYPIHTKTLSYYTTSRNLSRPPLQNNSYKSTFI